MKVFSLFSSLVVFSFLWSIERVHAHSNPARPLKQFTHPSTLALEIIPRSNHQSSKRSSPPSNNLRHDDTFRLTISVYDETYYLHLRPNEHLIHPAARINYYELSLDGHSYVSHSKPLLRGSFKAFWGEVIHVGYTEKRMREDAAGAIPRSHSGELGWARIVVHHQGDTARGIPPEYEGAFSVNGIVHHIMTKDNYLRTKTDLDPDLTSDDELDSSLVVWRESDVMTLHEESVAKSKRALLNSVPPAGESSIPICAHDRLMYNTDPQQNPILLIKNPGSDPWLTGRLGSDQQNISVFPRDDVGSSTGSGSMGTNFASSIGSSDGCPKTQKVLYMGVAADCNYVTIYGTQENATRQILTDWNSASNLYKSTFNVSLGIVELSVQSPSCPSTADPNFPWNVPCSNAELDSRLSLFSQWRGSKGDDGSGLWHLMSGCPTGSEVGIAWLATLCQQSSTGSSPAVVSGTAVSTAGRTEWQVVAHEIGHNFGAIHDCANNCTSTSQCCPFSTAGTCNANSQFIMSPVAQTAEKTFSPCSLGNICSVMKGVTGGRVNTTCLVDPDSSRQTISLQMCGNGIVEAGEDCDPGQGVDSACCDAATCKFKNNAVCDPESSPCCTAQCTFAPATQVCRPSRDSQCDIAETCTGNSSSCPSDTFAPNGKSCGTGDLKCASGQCTSLSLQCQTIGSSMGLKQSCPNRNDNTCQVSCQDPDHANQCVLLNSLLIDGSPCGYGGTCSGSTCQAGDLLATVKAWYTQNLQVAIPVTVIAGLVILLFLWFTARAIARCCGYRRSSSADPVSNRPSHLRIESHDRNGNPVVQPVSHIPSEQRPHGRREHWVDEALYNGR